MNIYALHGFLGRPSDWNILELPHQAIDLFNNASNPPENGLEEWACRFNHSIKTEENVLVGYSLGGRLALHVLVNQPSKWKAAIIVSAHCGFDNDPERQQRRVRDCGRADLFEVQSWDLLMDKWENQPLFSRSQNTFNREEVHYDRKILSAVLRHWSMSEQKDLKTSVEKLNIPILWIAGEHDPDYKNHGDKIHLFHPNSRVWIAPNSGHRVPWEITEQFIYQVKDFLQGVNHANKRIPSVAIDQDFSRH